MKKQNNNKRQQRVNNKARTRSRTERRAPSTFTLIEKQLVANDVYINHVEALLISNADIAVNLLDGDKAEYISICDTIAADLQEFIAYDASIRHELTKVKVSGSFDRVLINVGTAGDMINTRSTASAQTAANVAALETII